jgi:hypothetical protein
LRGSSGASSDSARDERVAADWARRLEAPGGEVGRAAWRRAHDPVLGARVATLAVDDHARRQHQPAAEVLLGECTQQHGGAEVVVRDIVGDVADVEAESDHRRLMADRLDAGDRPCRRLRISQVALDPVGARIQVVGPLAMRRREQRVEHAHVVAVIEQRVDHVRADESGAAGDEDHGLDRSDVSIL